jgi:hypothetical protein
MGAHLDGVMALEACCCKGCIASPYHGVPEDRILQAEGQDGGEFGDSGKADAAWSTASLPNLWQL